MAGPENQTLRILREFRNEMKQFRNDTANSFERIEQRLNSVSQAVVGEGTWGATDVNSMPR